MNIIPSFQSSAKMMLFQINFVILYDCVLNLSYFLSIFKLLKNVNVSQLGKGKNPTTIFNNETTKPTFFFYETKTIKMQK